MKKIILVLLVALMSFSTFAASKVIEETFVVGLAQTKVLDLGSNSYVENVVVQAEGLREDVIVEVMAKGVGKGTIYAPVKDPSYLVTIKEKVRYLSFRHLQGGSLKVISVVINYTKVEEEVSTEVSRRYYRSKVQAIADKTIDLVDELRLFTTLEEEASFLMPIKISAGKLKVMSMAHGDLSKRTRREMVVLKNNIEDSDLFLNELLEKSNLFDMVVELLTLKEHIKDILD